MERFDPYLDEVGQRLKGVDPARRAEILAELRSHLVLSQRSGVQELEMTDEEASRAALRSLGAAQNVAEDIALQEMGVSSQSSWRLLRWTLLLDLLLFVVAPMLLSLNASTYLDPAPFAALMLISPVVLIAFSRAVWRSRRWLIGPAATAIACTSLLAGFVAASPAYGNGIIAAMDKIDSGNHQKAWRQRIDADIAKARAGMAGLLANPKAYWTEMGYEAPHWVAVEQSHSIPYIPAMVPGPTTRQISLRWWKTPAEAAAEWDRNGVAWLQELERQREEGLRPLSEWPRLGLMLGIAAVHGGARIAQLAVVNAVVLLLLSRRRRRRVTRDPFLA